MTEAEIQKQMNPTEKWSRNEFQKSSLFRSIFSDKRVTSPENISTVQPEGKQLRNENDEEPWMK